MITNDQILQRPPRGGSPLASLVKGDISRRKFQQQVREKWDREEQLCDVVRQTSIDNRSRDPA